MPARSGSSVVRVPKAGELVAAELRRQIVTGAISPGSQLPSETVLMERYGVSRPTMREAFRILESESLITVLRGAHGGARALAPDASNAARNLGLLLQFQGVPLADVYRSWAEIEVAAVRAVAGLSAKKLIPLEELVKQAEEALDDATAFSRIDTQIHQTVIDLSGLRTLSVLAGMLLHIIDAHNALFLSVHGEEHERQADEHALRVYKKLLTLLRSGDAQAAADYWRRHLKRVEQYMVGDSDTTLVEVLS
ncbi:FadR/GntR family transcriptional regulator [Gordonia rhizosphera]|uniref:Putative GntR family transcriptional regulator n=1 Tax=Gordonia rhizosphera NBRC 16068 TaxID=1108045 RepID=K6W8E6_9ACTN|nr:GntR family transcriptional regulator [Gordonia rhizosphera]GAB88502.1 putative GntR family transcriptional regulator [Gordonia rhizosphera NBRC 16068]